MIRMWLDMRSVYPFRPCMKRRPARLEDQAAWRALARLGKAHPNHGPALGVVGQLQRAAVAAHDVVHDGKPQARARILGGEKRGP